VAASSYMSKPDDSEKTHLDEEPALYEDGPAERRASSHATFGGSRVWQDFGAPGVDRQIRLRTDWMTETTLEAFMAKFAVVGQIWKWMDHKGREYRVFFRALMPERIRGHEAYRVEMLLDVVEAVA
jgi:hypothetical protein